jgi:hypothetical protein
LDSIKFTIFSLGICSGEYCQSPDPIWWYSFPYPVPSTFIYPAQITLGVYYCQYLQSIGSYYFQQAMSKFPQLSYSWWLVENFISNAQR